MFTFYTRLAFHMTDYSLAFTKNRITKSWLLVRVYIITSSPTLSHNEIISGEMTSRSKVATQFITLHACKS